MKCRVEAQLTVSVGEVNSGGVITRRTNLATGKGAARENSDIGERAGLWSRRRTRLTGCDEKSTKGEEDAMHRKLYPPNAPVQLRAVGAICGTKSMVRRSAQALNRMLGAPISCNAG